MSYLYIWITVAEADHHIRIIMTTGIMLKIVIVSKLYPQGDENVGCAAGDFDDGGGWFESESQPRRFGRHPRSHLIAGHGRSQSLERNQ